MPPQAAGRAETPVLTPESSDPEPLSDHSSALIEKAISRLSPQQYREFLEAKKEFPSIRIERSTKPPNCFILFRSWYVAKAKKKEEEAKKKEEEEAKKRKEEAKKSGGNKGSPSAEDSTTKGDQKKVGPDSNEGSSNDKVSKGDGSSNDDKNSGGGKGLGKNGGPKNGEEAAGDTQPKPTSQTIYSARAGKLWTRNYPRGSPRRVPWERKSHRMQLLWKAMWPNGLPASIKNELYELSKKKNKSKVVSSPPSPSSTPPVAPRSFHPLPSPPISDNVDFENSPNHVHNDGDVSESEGPCGDEDEDEDYLPKKSSSRKKRSRRRQSKSRKKPRVELLTPVSMTRELSPAILSRSPSPTPVFSISSPTPSQSPLIPDISLSELNYEGPTAFTTPSSFSSPAPYEAFGYENPNEFFEQIAVGYNLEEQAANGIVDWNDTDLMPDLDPVGLYPVMNPPYCPDLLATIFTNDFSHHPAGDSLEATAVHTD